MAARSRTGVTCGRHRELARASPPLEKQVRHGSGHRGENCRADSIRLEERSDEIGMRRTQFVNRSVRVSEIGGFGAYDQPEWTGNDLGLIGKPGMPKDPTG